jgi:hypothetical protein
LGLGFKNWHWVGASQLTPIQNNCYGLPIIWCILYYFINLFTLYFPYTTQWLGKMTLTGPILSNFFPSKLHCNDSKTCMCALLWWKTLIVFFKWTRVCFRPFFFLSRMLDLVNHVGKQIKIEPFIKEIIELWNHMRKV